MSLVLFWCFSPVGPPWRLCVIGGSPLRRFSSEPWPKNCTGVIVRGLWYVCFISIANGDLSVFCSAPAEPLGGRGAGPGVRRVQPAKVRRGPGWVWHQGGVLLRWTPDLLRILAGNGRCKWFLMADYADRSIDWLIDWLIDCRICGASIVWLIDWLDFGCSINWLIDCFVARWSSDGL